MKLTIWGARGSIPTPFTTAELRQRLYQVLERSQGTKLEDGTAIERFIQRLPPSLNRVVSGNTSCFELRVADQLFILDMGSGLRNLGRVLMNEEFGRGEGVAHIFISHTHYDHLEGYPFFMPAFIPGNAFHFHTPFDDFETRLREFMRPPFFPVSLDYQQGTRHYQTLDSEQVYEIGGVTVRLMALNHPGGCFAYRFEHEGKALVYATDAEYLKMDPENSAPYEQFFAGADALIFDAMYTYEDAVTSKVEWGHSTAKVGAELAWRVGVRRLILTHHDPVAGDEELWSKLHDADHHLRYRARRMGEETRPPVEVLLAYEGLRLEF